MKITHSKIPRLKTGDEIKKINGISVDDILDVQFALADEDHVSIELLRNGELKTINFNDSVSLQYLNFERSVNKVKKCRNKCIFCFVDQLPSGLRKPLYLKDDDYRLSLLYGNFITLTNLTKKDINKITAFNISPLYVSLHSINPETRLKVFGIKEQGLKNFKYLCSKGIKFHIQMVAVPGLNDGDDLQESLKVLTQNEQVLSIGIVPAARTNNCPNEFETFDKKSAKNLIRSRDTVRRASTTHNNVYLADELFLLADQPIPSSDYYDDFPQLENGIGLSRLFLDGCKELATDLKAIVLTGKLSKPVVEEAFKNCPNFKIIAVENSLFGKEVTVTGLLGGRDIIRAVKDIEGLVLIPDIMLNKDKLFLDDLKVGSIQKQTKADIKVTPSTAGEFIEEIKRLK